MSYISSKVQVSEYVKKLSRAVQMDQLSAFTTISVSKALNLSRSLTSQYLNELVKEETVIKISSRPVYYFDRIELEKKYHVVFEQFDFMNLTELFSVLKTFLPQMLDFQKAIGHEGSLQYCITQIKSAVLYPEKGLPVLLYGEKGCGKSYLVKLIHEFCMNHALINSKASFVKMKVMKTSDTLLQKKELFGYLDMHKQAYQKGKLEEAAGGILYIQDVDLLSEDCQELLAEYIATGKYVRVNEEASRLESDVRIIMSTRIEPQSVLVQNLMLNSPVICQIPSLYQRFDDEKRAFVIKFFQEEQERLHKSIYLSPQLLHLLMDHEFEHNINELKKCITSICANAYATKQEEDKIEIQLLHLPIDLLKTVDIEVNHDGQNEIKRVDTLQESEKSNQILHMFEQFLEIYEQHQESWKEFLDAGQKVLRHYYDILIFQERYSDVRLTTIEKIIADILKSLKNVRSIHLPINCAYVLTRMILSTQKNHSLYQQWEKDHKDEIRAVLATMCQSMINEAILSDLIMKQLQSHVHIGLQDMNRIFLMMNISLYNKDIHAQDTIGIILSHGYSTATSIADAANTLLSTYIFEAIDMPLDTAIDEVNAKLNTFMKENRHIKNIILLVDMGSLEDIGKVIADSVNVGVINNISTSLALHIGTKILQHVELEEILRTACEEAQCRYKVLSIAKKEKAIVFTNDAGIVVAEKLCSLFRKSLPKKIALNMLEYDYHELEKHGDQDIVFKKYDVMLLVKPYHLKLSDVACVTLEEIMNFKDIDKVNQVLQEYLNKEEIEIFDQNLLKNFSMQSVMENLTILNAQKLLDYVSDAMNALQHIMKCKFQSKTIVGIYIHVCFLVERLVTKTALDHYKELHDFVNYHSDFIENVNRSFEAMLSHYHVTLPVSEIAYLYEYIENDNRKGAEDETF